jgi:hypothetical protein
MISSSIPPFHLPVEFSGDVTQRKFAANRHDAAVGAIRPYPSTMESKFPRNIGEQASFACTVLLYNGGLIGSVETATKQCICMDSSLPLNTTFMLLPFGFILILLTDVTRKLRIYL